MTSSAIQQQPGPAAPAGGAQGAMPQPNNEDGGATAAEAQKRSSLVKSEDPAVLAAAEAAAEGPPVSKQPSRGAPEGANAEVENGGAVILFCKTLTSSDSNGAGRVVIPKAAAEAHFPSVTSHSGAPIDFLDTFGTSHRLLLRFWENKSSKIFLLEGASPIQRAYGLSKGDSLVFSRAGDGRFHVAGYKGRHIPLSAIAGGVNAATAGAPTVQLPGSFRAPETSSRKRRKMSRPMRAPFGNVDLQCKVEGGRKAPVQKAAGEQRQGAPGDGVFRAVKGKGAHLEPGITQQPDDSWVAVLDLSGKKYQAFFGSQEEARQAIVAAGFDITAERQDEASAAVKAEL